MSDVVVAAPAGVDADQRSYVDWAAILAGTVLASAFSLVLLTFGSAIGLSLTSAYQGQGVSAAGFVIAAALWIIWVQVSGFFAGGYLTGRVRRRHHDATEHESDVRDGIHGLSVWAVGVLIGVAIAFSGLSAAVSTATTAVTTVAGGAATAAVASADGLANATDMTVDRLLRGNTTQPSPGAEPRDEIRRVLVSAVSTGTLDPADKKYLVDTVAARAGIDPQEAEKRVDDLYAQAQQVEASAREAADRARRIGVVAAFITAASLLIGAVGAYFGAVLGGNHRDKRVIVDGWVRPWAQ